MLLQSTELLDDIYLFTLTSLEESNSFILNGKFDYTSNTADVSMDIKLDNNKD